MLRIERFIADHNRCILCTRCVRVCAGDRRRARLGRHGPRRHLRASSPISMQPWGESETCTSCGKCVQVCPTGALFEKGQAVGEMTKRRDFLPYLNMMREVRINDESSSVATVWLDGCSGCHMSFLDMDERLIVLAEHVRSGLQPARRCQAFSRKCGRHPGRGLGQQR